MIYHAVFVDGPMDGQRMDVQSPRPELTFPYLKEQPRWWDQTAQDEVLPVGAITYALKAQHDQSLIYRYAPGP